ncbi:MAG: hypothetical protein A3K19_11720 [Lentisphaerae bacterium RIFOXYB12_FULL_65_16]|nr:MAG: hypothetical protein A3K18_23190 [Lentisphaerae bacterium RIFOXYA12_64_32]OGV87981.1 MAG: hypothetical protein A3K19_11720 [Lentisphaerae bacterium RIFOXYB12_FULL_65_16]
MNTDDFIQRLRADPNYADQIVHVHEDPARAAELIEPARLGLPHYAELLRRIGIAQLYSHQAQALRLIAEGRDVAVATGTASGKSLCYALPILATAQADREARALLLFPTKALCQDQFRHFSELQEKTGLADRLAGVLDGDTPSPLRRRLRDRGSVVFSNPDMVHTALMPQHARWAEFLAQLRFLVLDELHIYSGLFGSNMALLLNRFLRICRHYGSRPQIIACSATIANPAELAQHLTGGAVALVDHDGSPRGRRQYVLWNPPRLRETPYRSRRSANVEAHELMAALVALGVPTITFSKARVTAELIHRYVTERLLTVAPGQVSKVTPYRGGYRPEDRREIERRLFAGELLGVSTTPALELGIDVGGLDAAILVGYPGTLASFFQQAGRAGRSGRDALAILIGLDTSINQFILAHPGYLFGRCIERAVIEPENPFVLLGHLRCAAHELAVAESELRTFGPHAELVARILVENLKLRKIGDRWYYAAAEVPQHEVSLRGYSDANVLIQDADTGEVLGEVDRYDAEPIVHPEAIYMHRGDTYRVLELDLDRNLAHVRREEVDYYTQPLGGTDVHHIDHQLREKPFGTGRVYWGEVTAGCRTYAYEKIRFYSLDAVSVHGLKLPVMVLETMAVWIVPPEPLMAKVRKANLDVHAGLRGIGYATRMLLPLYITCDTLDFSHTIGSVNAPWNAIFIYERYPHGLGFTAQAYDRMHEILPAVREAIARCACADGCPCCVGKPLRQQTSWNVERGEGHIPSKAAALVILDGLLGDGSALVAPDTLALAESDAARTERLAQALRRRLERMREPQVFHPVTPKPAVHTEYPAAEKPTELPKPDVTRRVELRRDFERNLRQRMAKAGAPPVSERQRAKGTRDPRREDRPNPSTETRKRGR